MSKNKYTIIKYEDLKKMLHILPTQTFDAIKNLRVFDVQAVDYYKILRHKYEKHDLSYVKSMVGEYDDKVVLKECFFQKAGEYVIDYRGYHKKRYSESDVAEVFFYAGMSGHMEVVADIVKNKLIDINVKNTAGSTLLMCAVQEGNFDLTNYLVEQGANVEEKSPDGVTALMIASSLNCVPIVKCLRGGGAILYRAGSAAAVSIAVQMDSDDVLDYFMQEAENHETVDESGESVYSPILLEAMLSTIRYGKQVTLERILNKYSYMLKHDGVVAMMLIFAIKAEHVYMLKYLIEQYELNPNVQNNCGETSLTLATYRGDLDAVRYLISKGAKIIYPQNTGNALDFAIECGHLHILRYFIEECNVNVDYDNHGVHLLTKAAGCGQEDLVRYLLSKGANVDVKSQHDVTPVMIAIQNHKFNIAQILIQYGADINIANDQGFTPLMAAVQSKSSFLAAFITMVDGVNLEAKTNTGFTALLVAVEEGLVDMVEMLFVKADIYVCTSSGVNIITAPIISNNLHMLQYLFQTCDVGKKININKLVNELSPLMVAAKHSSVEMIEYLISQGADINQKSLDEKNIMFFAALGGNLNVVQYLMNNYGNIFDVDAQDSAGRTAFISASYNGHLDVVKYLVECGADPYHKDNYQNSALNASIIDGHLHMLQYFYEELKVLITESDWVKVLSTATSLGYVKILQYLDEQNIPLPREVFIKACHRTFVQSAACGNYAMIKYIVEHYSEIDIDICDSYGYTALLRSAEGGKLDVVQYLAAHGAGINKEHGATGNTALSFAAANGHFDVVQWFIEKSDMNFTFDCLGKAFNAAVRNGRTEIVEYLSLLDSSLSTYTENVAGVKVNVIQYDDGFINIISLDDCEEKEVVGEQNDFV